MSNSESRVTVDHKEIRQWVEERDGHPAKVKGTGEPGVLRIDYPGYSGEETLQEISWDEFFEAFEGEDLAFLYEEETEEGETSRFSKLVDRSQHDVEHGSSSSSRSSGGSSGGTTKAKKPPMENTESAKPKHHKMAKAMGQAVEDALTEMTNNVAQRGEEKAAGEYLVGYAIEKPEGLYHLKNGELQWQMPEDENLHIEISVRDGADGRFIPGLNVELTVLTADGDEVGTHRQPFLWHPWLYHYGRNWRLPGDGEYTFQVHIDIPDFPRHDKKNGKRYTQPVSAEFKGVKVKTKKPKK